MWHDEKHCHSGAGPHPLRKDRPQLRPSGSGFASLFAQRALHVENSHDKNPADDDQERRRADHPGETASEGEHEHDADGGGDKIFYNSVSSGCASGVGPGDCG
jgi:hypothetical protein